MSAKDYLDLNSISWKYINEGNVHIVLQLVGTNYVLRLIKEDMNSFNLEMVKSSINFAHYIMLPLLNLGGGEVEELVTLSKHNIITFITKLQEFRPKNRLYKSALSMHAIKAPNLTIVSPDYKVNYCIEIKPKEGFIPSSLMGNGICYYCLKQYLKVEQKQVKRISNYCPLDLFSGDNERMYKSIYNLLENPQNNFKIFKNSGVIFNDGSKFEDLNTILEEINVFNNSVKIFIKFIIKILLNDYTNSMINSQTDWTHISEEKTVCDSASILKNNNILSNLLKIQKYSDSIVKKIPKTEDYIYAETMLKSLQENYFDLNNEFDVQKFLDIIDPIHKALLALIARDCSVMISFTPEQIQDGSHRTITINNKEIAYNIAVTDLEPKSLATLSKRRVNEEKLLKIYKEFKK